MPLSLTTQRPFAQARTARLAKTPLPLGLSTREIGRLSGALRDRATFSAKVVNGEILERINQIVTRMVEGVTPESAAARAAGEAPLLLDPAQARVMFTGFLDDTGYVAAPEDVGTIKDLRSFARQKVLLDTNAATTTGYGQWISGQNETTLDLYPAQELVRIVQPLGQARDWHARWYRAGGTLHDGRMIALKHAPVWTKLGSPELFDDGLGNPWPPFAFGSGMDLRDIARDEAERLGVMPKNAPAPMPQSRGLNDDLGVQATKFSAALRETLANDPDLRMEDGVLTLR